MSSRCLHCGAQLPVLRKLTGGGDFCSDAHRQSYQEELNRIALTRLMKPASRREETPAAASSHAPAKTGAPAEPAPASFVAFGTAEKTIARTIEYQEEPLTAAKTLLYPERLVRNLEADFIPFAGLLRLDADLGPLPGQIPSQDIRSAPYSKPRNPAVPSFCAAFAQAPPFASAIETPMSLPKNPPEMRTDAAATAFTELELNWSELEIDLRVTGFDEGIAPPPIETLPPLITELRKIVAVSVPAPRASIVQSFQAIPAAAFRCRMPDLELMPLRPAITFASNPATSASGITEPRASASGITEPRASANGITEPRASASGPPRTPPRDSPLPASLTLGMSNADMCSPVFRLPTSKPPKLKLAVVLGVLAVAGGTVMWKGASNTDKGVTTGLAATAPGPGLGGGSIEMGGGGWVTEWAGDHAGSKRGKQLTLYKPSVALKDYGTEFVGQIETKGLGWVFRAKDMKNYYAMKIRIVRPGLEPGIALTRYAVIDGVEGQRVDVPLNITVRNDTLYKVKLEVRGAKFTTLVQGKAVDIWSDDRLKHGAFGFSNERGERAHIKSVSVSF